MTITTTGRKLALVGLLALVAALMPFTGASADHLEGEVTVLEADTNAEAAIEWSQEGAYSDDHDTTSADRVLIGRDNLFPDNLASGALQGSDDTGSDGPLLLTATNELYDSVSEEIERLADGGEVEVIILGGVEAIDDTVSDELMAHDSVSSVDRLGGPSRIETAIEVTEENGDSHALLARAYDADGASSPQSYVDSLAAGAWAADAGYGLLLTQTEVLTGSTADFLTDGGLVESVTIIGGTDAVSQDVEDELEAILGDDMVDRVNGANRWDTAVNIAGERGYDSSADADGVILSEGANENEEGQDTWADGLPAAATSAVFDYPVLLTNDDVLSPETTAFGGLDIEGDNAVVCGPFVNAPACEGFSALTAASDTSSEDGLVIDTDNDTYTFAGLGGSVTVEYDTTSDSVINVYFVDGDEVDVDAFRAALSIGDLITFESYANADGTLVVQVHTLIDLT